jgi:hypothetical protein
MAETLSDKIIKGNAMTHWDKELLIMFSPYWYKGIGDKTQSFQFVAGPFNNLA